MIAILIGVGGLSTAWGQTAGRPELAPELAEAARAASRIAGVSVEGLLAQLAHESAFRSDARNAASSATGPGQFLEGTWLELIRQHGAAYGLGSAASKIVTINGRPDIADPKLKARVLGLRRDPQLALAMAGRYLAAIGAELAKLLGRQASEFEIRVGYLLGAGGAALLLKAARATPKLPVTEILPDAAKANPMLFQGADGRPLGAAASLAGIRRIFQREREWVARRELGPSREQIGDLVPEAVGSG